MALAGLTLNVPAGQIVGLAGPLGAGKTSTLRILAGLLRPDEGTASVDSLSVTDDRRAVRRLVGYMPAGFGMYRNLGAQEYLEFYGGIHGVDRMRRPALARELLEIVGLADHAQDDVNRLHEGEKRRLCLARALVHDPPVLLLDEPLSRLEEEPRTQIRELIAEVGALGRTILATSRHPEELEGLCASVALIRDGRLEPGHQAPLQNDTSVVLGGGNGHPGPVSRLLLHGSGSEQ